MNNVAQTKPKRQEWIPMRNVSQLMTHDMAAALRVPGFEEPCVAAPYKY